MLNKIEKASSKATRTSEKSSREVEEIEVLHSNLQTRSQAGNASVNSDLYLVNYANNKGFALLSSDSRLRPIYAISDTGHIQMADTINNKALSMFLKMFMQILPMRHLILVLMSMTEKSLSQMLKFPLSCGKM